MLHHVEKFVAEAIHVLTLRCSPANHHHTLSYPHIGISDALIRLTSEHEITGIFERNALASQIPKTPSNLYGIHRPYIIHHIYGPVIPLQVNLLLSHLHIIYNITEPHPKECPRHYGRSQHRSG